MPGMTGGLIGQSSVPWQVCLHAVEDPDRRRVGARGSILPAAFFFTTMKRNSEIQKIAFVGDYLPRKCGIATFTYDLCTSVADPVSRARIASSCRSTTCPRGTTTRRRSGSRSRSRSSTPICGRPTSSTSPTPTSSASSTSTASSAARPAATSSACCATCGCRSSPRCTRCSRSPSAEQRRVLDQVAELSARVVVMSERAGTFLREIYDVPEAKIDLIAHGIPDMPFVDPELLQGPVRGRGQVRRADVRPALAQQGHRAHAPGDAGDPQGVSQLRLHRARGDPSEPAARAGRTLSDQPGAAGQGPGHQAERELLQPVRRDRRADSNSSAWPTSTSRPT